MLLLGKHLSSLTAASSGAWAGIQFLRCCKIKPFIIPWVTFWPAPPLLSSRPWTFRSPREGPAASQWGCSVVLPPTESRWIHPAGWLLSWAQDDVWMWGCSSPSGTRCLSRLLLQGLGSPTISGARSLVLGLSLVVVWGRPCTFWGIWPCSSSSHTIACPEMLPRELNCLGLASRLDCILRFGETLWKNSISPSQLETQSWPPFTSSHQLGVIAPSVCSCPMLISPFPMLV